MDLSITKMPFQLLIWEEDDDTWMMTFTQIMAILTPGRSLQDHLKVTYMLPPYMLPKFYPGNFLDWGKHVRGSDFSCKKEPLDAGKS